MASQKNDQEIIRALVEENKELTDERLEDDLEWIRRWKSYKEK